MTVAVMGGAGFIGRNVCKALSRKGFEVLSLDKVEVSSQEGATSVRMEISDSREIEEALLNYSVSTVVHLIGFPSVADCEKEPDLSFQLNALSTQRIVEAMRRAGVAELVFASTASVYGYGTRGAIAEDARTDPDTIYGVHKLISEEIVAAYSSKYGLRATTLRLFNVYGNQPHGKDIISTFLKAAAEGRPLTITGPNKFRDFVHVEDVAEAFASVVQKGAFGETFNIASGEKTTLGTIGEIFKSIAPTAKVVEKESQDDGTGLYADVSRARTSLGFRPRTSIDGMRDHIRQSFQNLKST